MRKLPKFILPTILVLILLVPDFRSVVSQLVQGAALHSGAMNASASPLERKEKFNFEFKIKDLDGNVKDFKEYQGKVIFLNLWATWCGPCRAEMPTIEELYNSVDHSQAVFVMLSIDEERNEPKVKKFIADKNFPIPTFMPAGYLTQQLRVPSIPTTFIIDKDGFIAAKEVGMRNYNTAKFKKFFEGLMN